MTYFANWYLVQHSDFYATYSLRQIRQYESNRSLRKATTPAKQEQKETLAAPGIES